MKRYVWLCAAAGLAPLVLSPATLRAEEPPPQRPLISLQFPGGTVAEYVEAVLKAAKDINIVVMPEAREFEIPPLQLTGVDVGSAMELLDGRAERRGRGIVELSVHEIEPFEGNGRAIYNVSSSVAPQPDGRVDEAGVWTIAALLGAEMKAQDVLTAIQTAVDLISEQYGPAEIRFHEATGLVIARGHSAQMHTIEDVIKRLREGLDRTRGRSPKTEAGSPGASAVPDECKQQIQALTDRVAELQARLDAVPELKRRAPEESK